MSLHSKATVFKLWKRNYCASLSWGFSFVYEICFSQLEPVVEQQSTTCRCISQKKFFPVIQFSEIVQHSEQLLGAKLKVKFRQQVQSDM